MDFSRLWEDDVVVTRLFSAHNHWKGGSRLEIKNRNQNNLFLNLEGTRRYIPSVGEPFEVPPMTLMLMPAGTSYATIALSAEGSTGIGTLFTLQKEDGTPIELGNELCILVSQAEDYREDLEALSRIICTGGAWDLRAKSLFYSVLYRLSSESFSSQGEAVRSLQPAIEYLESNIRATVSADTLASLCFLSRSTFFRRFRAHYGTSPTEYHLRQRISRGRQMLESGLYTVEQTAEFLGFCDAAHFSRTFYRLTGVHAGKLRPE